MHKLLLLLLMLMGFAAPCGAQDSEMPEEGSDPSSEETSTDDWEVIYPANLISEPDPALLLAPGRYLAAEIDGKLLEIQPREILRDKDGINRDLTARQTFKDNRVYWPNTTVVRAYKQGALIELFAKYVNDPDAWLTYTIKLQGRKAADEVRKTPFKNLKILRLPQSWENIWVTQVASVPSDQRVERVKAFDAFFREEIANEEGSPSLFSRAEQNEFARFYQDQFNYARNANPDDPSIYHELAAYHQGNDNIDAMIGVYMDAVRHKFEDKELQRFHLAIGEAMVRRLSLFEEAKYHLEKASGFAMARLLLVQCHFELEEHDQATEAAESLSEEEMTDLWVRDEIDDAESIARRAVLLKARAFVAQHKLESADKTFGNLLEEEGADGDEAAWMLASMYVYRGYQGDGRLAINAILSRDSFKKRLAEAQDTGGSLRPTELPYDPIGAKALTIWADAQVDPKIGVAERIALDAVTPVLDYAALLDPLNADPFLVHGKAREAASDWSEAEAAYRRGLEIEPNHLGLNYRLGVLLQRAGSYDRANERFLRTLRESKNFYHALNRLAENSIRLAENDRLGFLTAKQQGNEEAADLRFSKMIEEFRQAASLYATSLTIEDNQEAVRTALAELYCRLADISPRELATSYLNRARVMADRARRAADSIAQERQEMQMVKVSRHAHATTPPLAAHCIFAYASYQLGSQRYYAARDEGDATGYSDSERFFQEAQDALDVVETQHNSLFYFPNGTHKEFAKTNAYLWAKKWRTRIEVNSRRTRMSDEFDREVTQETFAGSENLGFGWAVQYPDTLDRGVKGVCSVENNSLMMRLVDQAESGHISRLSRIEGNDALASFEIEISSLSESSADRGVHLTIVSTKGKGGVQRIPAATLMLGVDSELGVFWEVRTLAKEEFASVGESMLPDTERIYIAPSQYGGALELGDTLTLGISRMPSDKSTLVQYSFFVNGWEIPSGLHLLPTGGNAKDLRTLSDAKNLAPKSKFVAFAGVWMRGDEGDSGQMKVEKATWVIDSNLDGRD